jgi:hypothetical protein
MPRPLYPRGKSTWYPLDRRLGGPQSWSGRFGEEKRSKQRKPSTCSYLITMKQDKIIIQKTANESLKNYGKVHICTWKQNKKNENFFHEDTKNRMNSGNCT